MHGDLADVLMILGLVTFAKIKLQPPSFITRSAIHLAMTHLLFVVGVGKLGGGMWLWGAEPLGLWVSYNDKENNSATFYLTCDN
jgi:hypothetical protein